VTNSLIDNGRVLEVDFIMAKVTIPKMRIEFDVSPEGIPLNPPGQFPSPILLARKMGRAGHMYQRYVKPHELLSSTEAAMILKVSLQCLHEWSKNGVLKAKRVKDRLFFVSRDVQKLARKRGVHPVPENPEREKIFREARRKGLQWVKDEKGTPWVIG
jgi:hypothetical protein